MISDKFKILERLSIPDINVLVQELENSDLSDEANTDKLITQIFVLFNSLNLSTGRHESETRKEFWIFFETIKILLKPLIESSYIQVLSKSELVRPFIVITSDLEKAHQLLFSKEQIYINDLLIDLHADVVNYSDKFKKGEVVYAKNKEDESFIFGRGANDMLTQVAVTIVLLYRLYRENITPPFITISTDEELNNCLHSTFYERLHAFAALSLEPTGNLLGGFTNEILDGVTYGYPLEDISKLNIHELKNLANELISSNILFKDCQISLTVEDSNLVAAFTSFNTDNNLKVLNDLRTRFRLLLEKNYGNIVSTQLFGNTPFHSAIDSNVKKIILEGIHQEFEHPVLIDDPNVITFATNNPRVLRTHVLLNNFQFSLGLHYPERTRNTFILSFPEWGGRHSETESVKIGPPSKLVKILLHICKHLRNPKEG